MDYIIYRLLEIAAREGRADLIDTWSERCEALGFLADEYTNADRYDARSVEIIEQCLYVLDSNYLTFRPVPPYYENFPVCVETESDCYQPLVPISEEYFNVFPIRSGMGPFFLYLDYVFVTVSDWLRIIGDINNPANSLETEEENLLHAVSNFDNQVASRFDIPGYLGNIIPIRWQQDCVSETIGLSSFLYTLDANGYLTFFDFDIFNISMSVPLVHYAARLEADGTEYAVDTWIAPTIQSRELWEFLVEQNMMRRERF